MAGPAYQQVADKLRAAIEQGQWGAGERLPGEMTLVEQFAVSRNTVRRALDVLADANIVRKRQGAGTFVANQGVSHVLGDLRSFTETLRGLGKEPGIRAIRLEVDGDPPLEASEFLPGRHLWLLERVRTGDGRPFCRMQSWLPDAIAAEIDPAAMAEQQSLYAALEGLDIKPSEATEVIRSEAASAHDAASLEVPEGSPVLSIYRWTSDHRGSPIEYVRSTSPGDRYEYVIKLRQ